MREGNHPNVDTLCELVSDLGTNRPHQMLQRQMLLLRLDAYLLMLHTGIPVGGCQHGVSTVQSRSCESGIYELPKCTSVDAVNTFLGRPNSRVGPAPKISNIPAAFARPDHAQACLK